MLRRLAGSGEGTELLIRIAVGVASRSETVVSVSRLPASSKEGWGWRVVGDAMVGWMGGIAIGVESRESRVRVEVDEMWLEVDGGINRCWIGSSEEEKKVELGDQP